VDIPWLDVVAAGRSDDAVASCSGPNIAVNSSKRPSSLATRASSRWKRRASATLTGAAARADVADVPPNNRDAPV